MKLKQLHSQELLSRTQHLVAEERRVTLALIEHLEEIQSRRLHAELGYESLWAFCIQYLGLSEGAAQRRIAAMRLTRDVPEAKAALQSGKLSLSNAAKVQGFRQTQKKKGLPPANPRELIQKMENLSQRECEAKLFELSPEALPSEHERVVSANHDREIRLVISAELHDQLQLLKGLIAHSRPNASYAELLEYLMNETLPRLQKKKGLLPTHEAKPEPSTQVTIAAAVKGAAELRGPWEHLPEKLPKKLSETPSKTPLENRATQASQNLPAGQRVTLPAALQRAVSARSGGRCEYVYQGRRCHSRYLIEIDHRIPLAAGGGHELAQLRHLCREHNLQQYQAWLELGAPRAPQSR